MSTIVLALAAIMILSVLVAFTQSHDELDRMLGWTGVMIVILCLLARWLIGC